MAPVVVGGMVDHLGFSLEQAGYVLSVEQAAMALATFPALLWLHRANWHRVGYLCLVLIIIGDLISAGTSDYFMLCLVRFFTGVAGGTVMILTLATVNMTADQDRVFGLWVVGQLVLGAAGLALLPSFLPDLGLSAYYLAKACLFVPLLFTIRYLPTTIAGQSSGNGGAGYGQLLRTGVFGLAAIFLFYVSLSGVWAYLERLGLAAGIELKTVGLVLALSSVAGILGASSATALSAKAGRRLPIIAGFALLLSSIGMLFGTPTLMLFIAAACIFKFGWTFVLPYLLACLTSIDASGRLITTTNFMIGSGLAAGPAISGYLMRGDSSFTMPLLVGIVAGLCSFALIIPLSRKN